MLRRSARGTSKLHYRCDSCRILNRLPLSGTTFRNIVGQGRKSIEKDRSSRLRNFLSSFSLIEIASFFSFLLNKLNSFLDSSNLQFSLLPRRKKQTFHGKLQRSGSRINATNSRSPCNPRRKGFPEKGSTVFQKAPGRALTIERADRHAGRLSLSLRA